MALRYRWQMNFYGRVFCTYMIDKFWSKLFLVTNLILFSQAHGRTDFMKSYSRAVFSAIPIANFSATTRRKFMCSYLRPWDSCLAYLMAPEGLQRSLLDCPYDCACCFALLHTRTAWITMPNLRARLACLGRDNGNHYHFIPASGEFLFEPETRCGRTKILVFVPRIYFCAF